MPATRDIGAIPAADLSSPGEKRWCHFLRVDWPAPDNIKRLTNHPSAKDVVADIDGTGNQTWVNYGIWIPDMGQSEQTIAEVSVVEIVNADNAWGDLVNTHGVRNIPVYVYLAWYNPTTLALVDKILIFKGVGDKASVDSRVKIAVLPGRPPFSQKIPRRRFTPAFGFNFLPPANFKFEFGSVISHELGSAPGVTPSQNPYSGPPVAPPGDLGPPGGGGGGGGPVRPPTIVVPPHGAGPAGGTAGGAGPVRGGTGVVPPRT